MLAKVMLSYSYDRRAEEKLYVIFPPTDGKLYHQSKSHEHLMKALWGKCLKGPTHFHAKGAYIPYSGGGFIFDAKKLIQRGVKPLWYPVGNLSNEEYGRVVGQVTEDHPEFFKPGGRVWEAQWYKGRNQYIKEREWMYRGRHFCFDWRDIEGIWVGVGRRKPQEQMVEEVRNFLPKSVPVYEDEPR